MSYRRSRIFATVVRYVSALSLAVAWAGVYSPTAGAAQASAGEAHKHTPGTVVSQKVLPSSLWLPSAEEAYRVEYLSTSWSGRPDLVSGAVFVPHGTPPPGGWPVVSWAHGTVGVADRCAPSIAGRSQRDVDYLDAWLSAGYLVVATDYEGLGTPGLYPYDDGRSEAYSVVDMVRASAHVVPGVSRSWVAIGQSEGGHASLWTASLASSYAPELDFRGTVATAPATQFLASAEQVPPLNPASPANAGIITLAAGYLAAHPGWDPSAVLTPRGIEVLALAETRYCYDDLNAYLAQQNITNGDVLTDMNALLTFAKLMQYDEIPIAHYREPVFIAQGTADQLLFPGMTEKTANELAAAGTDVTFRYYEGADHNTILAAALPDLLTWVNSLRD